MRGEKGKSQADPKGGGEEAVSNSTGGREGSELSQALMLAPSLHCRGAGILARLCTGGSPSQTGHSDTRGASPQQQRSAVKVLVWAAPQDFLGFEIPRDCGPRRRG